MAPSAVDDTDLLNRATAAEDDASPPPKALLVFAHPDDEVIALGGRLGRFGQARFVHVTDGAPGNELDSRAHGFSSLDGYRQARRGELDAALSRAGLGGAVAECFDIPDQEASLRLSEITFRLYSLFKADRPDVVFTHPYEGGHPDHDACAFGVHRAAALLGVGTGAAPLIVEAPFYHGGREGIETGSFLAHPQKTQEVVYRLSAKERSRKQALIDCFTTQHETLRIFRVECERFRIAPKYEFGKPPVEGPALYDGFPWGMTSQRFCELACEADGAIQSEGIHQWG